MSDAKKWTVISLGVETERWASFSNHVTKLGVANEFVAWDGPTTDFSDLATIKQFHFVRISSQLGPGIARRLPVQSSLTTMLGVVDGMICTEHGWWPQCALHEALGEILIHLGQRLDQRGSVLIAGAGGAARTAIGAFFRAGFKRFLLTDHDPTRALETINDVRRRFFGLELIWTPKEQIVTLSTDCSAVVNCTSEQGAAQLMSELSYLNFLQRSGFVFDLSRRREENVLVTEAREAGVGLVTGVDVAARVDTLWAKWAFGVDMDLAVRSAELDAVLT